MRRQGIDRAIAPQVFLPNRQEPEDMMDVIVRARVPPAALANIVQKEVQAIDKNVARFPIDTVVHQLGEQTSERRFDAFLLGSFAAAALFLSAIGVFVLLRQIVAQRTGEIGVRMALGATPASVIAMLLRQGLTLALAGVVIGSMSAWWTCRLLSKLLYGLAPTDPVTFGISAFVLIAVAGAACWIPSHAAAHIDPTLALRSD
jgi:ABC-type antimicrobial peptide transport system permease subunit